jgi:RNA polymerase sigma-70 factor (ECF subfamily)
MRSILLLAFVATLGAAPVASSRSTSTVHIRGFAFVPATLRVSVGGFYAAALQVLHDPQEAQDCVHDVLLRLWRRGCDYRVERGSLRAFLAVCVRNEALSRSRKAYNRDRIVRASEPSRDVADFGSAVADRESIRTALDALGERHRETIGLAYYGHLTLDEIARKLDEPLGTIKSRLSAALRKLRETLANEEARHA